MSKRYPVRRIPFRLLSSFLMAIALCFAPATGAETAKPDEEKRSSIHEVDAYVQLSEDKTIKEIRKSAFDEAKRQVVEMAETYIKSKSEMVDFELTFDFVSAQAEGNVTILEQVDHGIKPDNRYHVWIRGEVRYQLSSPKGAKPVQSMDPSFPLTVEVSTPKKVYHEGERIEITIRGNRDFYARVVDVTADGNIIQLLPNQHRREAFFKAGVPYRIPGEGDKFSLTVTPPFGQDNIVVYASERPLGDVAVEPIGQGLSLYRGSQKSLGAKTRGIAVVPTVKTALPTGKPKKQPGAEFYEATWSIITTRSPGR